MRACLFVAVAAVLTQLSGMSAAAPLRSTPGQASTRGVHKSCSPGWLSAAVRPEGNVPPTCSREGWAGNACVLPASAQACANSTGSPAATLAPGLLYNFTAATQVPVGCPAELCLSTAGQQDGREALQQRGAGLPPVRRTGRPSSPGQRPSPARAVQRSPRCLPSAPAHISPGSTLAGG